MKSILQKVFGAAAVVAVAAALAFNGVSAQGGPPPACKTITDNDACVAREDCSWVRASIDSKTGKEKRKAYCRVKPKTPPKKT